ncbi:nuclease-related domain-containing protein [Streptosporangium sp. NPDC048047]|uniref:nuclease-related domain-containing protein n=1 Tax=Streptosporangium sp. NPDC048047 TaxID=3155748 RepID=UPI0034189A60
MFRPPASGAGASAWARYREEMARGRRRRVVVRVLLAAAAAAAVAVLIDWRVGLVAGLLVALADAVYRWRTHEAVRTWRRGALGERRTARALRRLERAGHLVLHDRALPRGKANVDHLVVGPCGVFVVDSKNWNRDRRVTRRGRYVHVGTTWGDNVTKSVVYEARSVAAALRAALGAPVEVVPLLAVHGPHVPLRGMAVGPDRVRMLRASMVAGWILRQGTRLDPVALAQLQRLTESLFPPYVDGGSTNPTANEEDRRRG